jgi:glucokinase
MEIGHVQVMPDGPRCGCGQLGCLESVSSRLAVAAAVAQAAYRGQAPTVLRLAGTDLASIRSGVLAAAIESGEVVVEQIVRDAARHIGLALAGVVNLLAPDVVVLGGGMVEAMPELFVSEVGEAARRRAMPSLAASLRVLAARLGDDATAIGAAAWAQAAEGSPAE